MLSALIGGSAFRRVSDGQMPEFVKALQEFINLITTHKSRIYLYRISDSSGASNSRDKETPKHRSRVSLS